LRLAGREISPHARVRGSRAAGQGRGGRLPRPLSRSARHAVKRGEHKPPCSKHGEWRFARSDARRGLTILAKLSCALATARAAPLAA
jgi:hypothetical protein